VQLRPSLFRHVTQRRFIAVYSDVAAHHVLRHIVCCDTSYVSAHHLLRHIICCGTPLCAVHRMLRHIICCGTSYVEAHHISPLLRGQDFLFLDRLTDGGTDRLSQNFGNQPPPFPT